MKKELSPWGKQCKMQMVALDKSLTALSDEVFLSKQYVSAIINGRVLASEYAVKAISKALDVDINLAKTNAIL